MLQQMACSDGQELRCWSGVEVLCVPTGEEMLTERDALPGVSEVAEGCPAEMPAWLLASTRVALAPALVQGCLHPHPGNIGVPGCTQLAPRNSSTISMGGRWAHSRLHAGILC